MAQEQTIVKRFDLSNGFVTEFTELNFPANATVDESNMTIENDGSRKRRKGVDYEDSHVLHSSDTWQSGDAVAVFEWRGAGGDPDDNFVVVQVGPNLHFYDRDADSFSANKESGTVDLTAEKQSAATNTQVRQTRVDAAAGTSRLFVAGRYIEPFYVEWNGSSFSTTTPTLEQRDFEGLDDGLDIDERPNTLSSDHNYNLQNQGWASTDIDTFQNDQGSYPSNADIWHFGKFIDTGLSGRENFDPGQVVLQDFGNTRAPRGHFLKSIYDDIGSASQTTTTIQIDDFTHDGSTATVTVNSGHQLSSGDTFTIDQTSFDYEDSVSGTGTTFTYDEDNYSVSNVVSSTVFEFSHSISTFVTFETLNLQGEYEFTTISTSATSIDERPTTVAFFAGRAWWAGIEEANRQGKVYFSQILENEDNIGRCYQEADPTSEHISDLVDTDGGVLTIAEMGSVKKMVVVGKNLVLFADNGVWNIGPGEQGFFTATSFSVRKISNIETASPEAVVLAEGTPVAWAFQGIYGFGEDQVSGFLNAQSLSVNTIQTFYRDIPDESKNKASVTYDDVAKKFYWLYSSDANNPDKYDKCLIFDARQEAFQKYDFKSISNGPFIAGASTTLGFDERDSKVKLFTIQENDGEFTFSEFNEDTFHDWKTFDSTGVDADAFVVTGYETGGEAGRSKQTPVVTFLFRKTETGTDSNGDLINPGSCMMQGRWDWTNSANSNKWNPERQVYRLRRNYFPGSHPSDYEDGYPVVWSRNKIRGRGNAFNMKLRSEEDHDLHLIGWQITMTGSTAT